jgi:hypothetical protein
MTTDFGRVLLCKSLNLEFVFSSSVLLMEPEAENSSATFGSTHGQMFALTLLARTSTIHGVRVPYCAIDSAH